MQMHNRGALGAGAFAFKGTRKPPLKTSPFLAKGRERGEEEKGEGEYGLASVGLFMHPHL